MTCVLLGVTLAGTLGENQPPSADLAVTPRFGNAEDGDGRGTTFRYMAGMSGEAEDDQADLQIRMDWEGDGVWDTPWGGMRGLTHVYSEPGVYTPHLQVMDTAGAVDTTTADSVQVVAMEALMLGATVNASVPWYDGARYYRFDVQEGLLTLDAMLQFGYQAGVNYDLFLLRGEKPDRNACSPPACQSSRSFSTGGREQVCIRFPEPGTYFILVQAQHDYRVEVPGPYELSTSGDRLGANPDTLDCLAYGPVPYFIGA